MRWQRPGGRRRVFATSGRPVFDGDGLFCGYRGTSTEITARVRVEEALRESEARYRDIEKQLQEAPSPEDIERVKEMLKAADTRVAELRNCLEDVQKQVKSALSVLSDPVKVGRHLRDIGAMVRHGTATAGQADWRNQDTGFVERARLQDRVSK